MNFASVFLCSFLNFSSISVGTIPSRIFSFFCKSPIIIAIASVIAGYSSWSKYGKVVSTPIWYTQCPSSWQSVSILFVSLVKFASILASLPAWISKQKPCVFLFFLGNKSNVIGIFSISYPMFKYAFFAISTISSFVLSDWFTILAGLLSNNKP